MRAQEWLTELEGQSPPQADMNGNDTRHGCRPLNNVVTSQVLNRELQLFKHVMVHRTGANAQLIY